MLPSILRDFVPRLEEVLGTRDLLSETAECVCAAFAFGVLADSLKILDLGHGGQGVGADGTYPHKIKPLSFGVYNDLSWIG